jgi:hypothetical protein
MLVPCNRQESLIILSFEVWLYFTWIRINMLIHINISYFKMWLVESSIVLWGYHSVYWHKAHNYLKQNEFEFLLIFTKLEHTLYVIESSRWSQTPSSKVSHILGQGTSSTSWTNKPCVTLRKTIVSKILSHYTQLELFYMRVICIGDIRYNEGQLFDA